jgi:peptide/nickel transport system substrate-binding protein
MSKVRSPKVIVIIALLVGLLAVGACSGGGGEQKAAPAPAPAATGAQPAAPAPKAPAALPAETPKSGGTASYVIRSDPPGWDVWGRTRFFDPTRMTAEMVFNPLYIPAAKFGADCTMEVVPELAESWKYTDDKTLELKLRQGVKWHNKPPLNGRELVADDVVYTLEQRYKKGLAGQGYVGQLFYDRAEAVDKYTVRIYLKQPFDFFTAYTDGHRQGWIVAKEAAGPDGKEWLEKPDKSWIGTGPFIFKEHQPGVKVVFEKNPEYFKKGKPYLDRIEAAIIPDTATRVAGLRSGQLDMFPAASPAVAQELRQTNPDMFVKTCLDEFRIGLSMRLDKAPYTDVRVRRAISMAINTDAIIKSVLFGNGPPSPVLCPANPEALKVADFPTDVRKYLEYRPDEAKKLLAEAGYPNGFKAEVLWTPGYESPWQETAEAFVTMLRGIGIDAKLNMTEYTAFLRITGTAGTGEFPDMSLRWSQEGSTNDFASQRWSKVRPLPTYHIEKVQDAKLDALVEELWRTLDPAKHRTAARDLQIYLAQQRYEVLGPVWGNGVIAGPRVKNLGWRGTNKMYTALFEQVWVSK